MPQQPSKRNPLLHAPDSQEIMTGARRRQASQPAGMPASHNASTTVQQDASKPARQQTSTPVKRKATFYLTVDLQKALKRVAFTEETNQSQVVEDALKEYISKRPHAGAV
jgi:hypothetical protein